MNLKTVLDGWKARAGVGILILAGFAGLAIAEGASLLVLVAGLLVAGWGIYSTWQVGKSSETEMARIQRDALDHLLMPVAVFDGTERLVLWNARFREAYAYAFDRLESRGVARPTFRELVNASLPPDATEIDRQNAWRKAVAERPKADGNFREFKCNNMGWVQVGRSVMPSGLELRVAHDINELKAREVALEAALERAREAEQITEDLISAVSHDLRSPLASISSGACLWQHAPDKVNAQDIADMIVRTSSRMRQLIDGLLDSFGKRNFEQSQDIFDLKALVSAVAENAGFLPKARDLKLGVDWQNGIAAERFGSEQAIWQILTNLTTNAVNYTDEGEITVVVRTGEADKIILEVRDTGPGIPEDKQADLFERYNRLGAYKTQGHGLGLSIVKELVDAVDGEIRVASTVGKGTSFIVTLRLPEAKQSATELAAAPLVASQAG